MKKAQTRLTRLGGVDAENDRFGSSRSFTYFTFGEKQIRPHHTRPEYPRDLDEHSQQKN